ncbi:hypothetical protein K504DRAFT_496433 [Pleomassaria siparia CBS 279.74]|uniref:F-box domain-containing protein n=1 Tax=Pleomassaria siparia CBS 279.74 TaxID=1314801 RepID=A0A6G1KPN0_9PLEO|nr:hypothetical protein K504DRAFT_496433 [Pleomassaria siparia CBS 279.74]
MDLYNPTNKTAKKVTVRDELWYLDYYEAPWHLKPPPRILELPNEILAAIAQFATNRDLCHLSLVSRRMRDVAQSALLKPARIPHNGIRKFVETLADRPDLRLIKEVDLGDFGCDQHDAGLGECAPEMLEKLERLVSDIKGDEQWSKLIKEQKGGDYYKTYGTDSSFFLAVLLIIAPNISTLSVELRPLANMTTTRLVSLSSPEIWMLQVHGRLFDEPLTHLLEDRLEELTIPANTSCFKGDHLRNISFINFNTLKRLNVPMNVFVHHSIDATNPTELEIRLPQKLEYLKIQACNRLAFECISSLLDCLREGQVSKLRQVDLSFQGCLRSSLVLLCHGEAPRIDKLRRILRALASDYRCKVTAYTRAYLLSKYEASDLLSELDTYANIPSSEAWMIATKDEQFGDAIMRKRDGTPRERTKAERELFCRNQHISTALLSSPTFDATAWKKAKPFENPFPFIRGDFFDGSFFRGTKYTKMSFDEKGKSRKCKEKSGKSGRSPRSPKRGVRKSLEGRISDLII